MLEEFREHMTFLRSCCLTTTIEPADVVEATHSSPSEACDGPPGAHVFRTVDGWFALGEWEDYTGHGCQCGSDIRGPFPTEAEAIRMGLSSEERRLLHIEVEGLDP